MDADGLRAADLAAGDAVTRIAASRGRPFIKGSVPSNFKDMSGFRTGKLTVMARAGSKDALALWLCKCECGKTAVVSGELLRRGQLSCGCARTGRITHGKSKTRAYAVWNRMIQRCTNPKIEHYPEYGGRGITVCDQWRDFANFFADMGECPVGHSIERKNNDGNYEPENCCWLLTSKQPQNRRGNVYLTVGGERVCLAEAARRVGVPHHTLRYRIKAGWPQERALAP